MDDSRHRFYRDGPKVATGTRRSTTSGAEKNVGSVYRKGSLGFALEEHRSELKKSPLGVIELLSRSWSSSSMRAFEMIAHSLDCELQLQDEAENRGEKHCKQKEAFMNGNGQIQRWLWMQQSIRHLRQSWADMIKLNQVRMRRWLKEKLCSSEPRNERRKEEQRLQAAMSVAGLAAVIASFSAKSAGDTPDKKKLATAAAAALVAVQCAEVAELMGAQQRHVASVIDAAIAAATPADILALTAAAATCTTTTTRTLRGETTGRGRHLKETKLYQNRILRHSSTDLDFTRKKQILARGTELPTCITNGKTQLKTVYVFAKQSLVILRVRTKHLGGAFTTFKDYTIMEVVDESKETTAGVLFTNEVNGYCCICIRTLQGEIRITFKDKVECSLWVTTISHFLLSTREDHLSHTSIDPGLRKYSFSRCFYLSLSGFV